jgi:hypothetical protein
MDSVMPQMAHEVRSKVTEELTSQRDWQEKP